jgi:hypothetical protein
MASNRFARAGAIGGKFKASDLQKMIARQTIFITKPWKKRLYRTSIALVNFPNTTAIEAAYLAQNIRAAADVAIVPEGYCLTIEVSQRREFMPDDIVKITQLLEGFRDG